MSSKLKFQSYGIKAGLWLVLGTLVAGVTASAAPAGINRYVAIDRSGSMYGVMPHMRQQMKDKILSLVKEGDTLTVVVFSSRGECVTVIEGEAIASIKDLREVYIKLDRELRATNLTGFVDPLNRVREIAARVKAKNPGMNDFWFLSDGCDNQWSRTQILDAMKLVGQEMDAVTIVEFGNYADRPLLAEMATAAGGKHIFAESFRAYEPMFEKAMAARGTSSGKIEAEIEGTPINFVFGLHNGDLLTFPVVNGCVSIPSDLTTIAFLSENKVGTAERELATCSGDGKTNRMIDHAYAALSLFSVRRRSDLILPILKSIGDKKLVTDFGVCFNKQQYSAFMDATRVAAFGTGRFLDGYDPNAVPPEDCFTIWNLLAILTREKGSKLLIDRFKYNKIGRAQINASEKLTLEEASKVAANETLILGLTQKAAGEKKTAKLKEIQAQKATLQAEIDAILASKKDPPEFVDDPCPEGIDMTDLVFNEEQPNISIRTRRTGKVRIREWVDDSIAKLSVVDPAHDPSGATKAANDSLIAELKKLPDVMDTFIWRNYAIVKDGLINVEELPVTLPGHLWAELLAAGMPMDVARIDNKKGDGFIPDTMEVTFFLRKIPVVNRAMIKAVSGRKIFELEYELCKARAAQAVFNNLRKSATGGKVSAKFEAEYGKGATLWLKESFGLTEGGYNPKKSLADSKDFYVGKFLTVLLYEEGAIKSIAAGKMAQGKLDTLPAVDKVQEAIDAAKASGKPTKFAGGRALIADVIEYVKGEAKKFEDEAALTKWVVEKQEETVKLTRRLLREKAQIAFTILVGQVWLTEPEFAVPAEIVLKGKTEKTDKKLLGNMATLDAGGAKFDFVIGQYEEQVQI